MSVRVFTIEEANNILPQVEAALRFVREQAVEIVGLQDRIAVLSLIGAEGKQSPEHSDWIRLRAEFDERVGAYKGRLEELNGFGCVVKDLNHGLVDFYFRKGDRLVFLCWRLGEEAIGHWHEIEGGYSGRRPVSEL